LTICIYWYVPNILRYDLLSSLTVCTYEVTCFNKDDNY
jgi:hypothetical protein